MSSLFEGKTLAEARRREHNKEIEILYTIEGLTLQNGGTHIQLRIFYDLGGPNHWTGGVDERGIFASVKPIKVEGSSFSFRMGNGYKKHLKSLKRFSQKQLNEDMVNDGIIFMTEVMEARPDEFFVLEEVA